MEKETHTTKDKAMSEYRQGITHGQGTALLWIGVLTVAGWGIEQAHGWLFVGYGVFLALWPWPWKRAMKEARAENPAASPSQGDPGDEDALLVCAYGCGETPHRFRPSPEAGPFWRCSECGEITPALKVRTIGGKIDQRALIAERFGDE